MNDEKCMCEQLRNMKIYDFYEKHGIASASTVLMHQAEQSLNTLKKAHPEKEYELNDMFEMVMAKRLIDALTEISETCKDGDRRKDGRRVPNARALAIQKCAKGKSLAERKRCFMTGGK